MLGSKTKKCLNYTHTHTSELKKNIFQCFSTENQLIRSNAIADCHKFAPSLFDNNDNSLPPLLAKPPFLPVPESIPPLDFPDGILAYLNARATNIFQPLLPTDFVGLENNLTQAALLINSVTHCYPSDRLLFLLCDESFFG